jgi:hypothetical protein
MTQDHRGIVDSGTPPRPSTLPFDPADLTEMRVLPAQFARMLGISRQAVSKAIKNGKVVLGADGRMDPRKALRQYLDNSDPARIRVRTFRQAMTETDELRARVRALEADVDRLRAELEEERQFIEAREKAAQFRAEDEAARQLHRFVAALGGQLDAAVRARAGGTLEQWLDELIAVEFYGMDLDEYRAGFAAATTPDPSGPEPPEPDRNPLGNAS